MHLFSYNYDTCIHVCVCVCVLLGIHELELLDQMSLVGPFQLMILKLYNNSQFDEFEFGQICIHELLKNINELFGLVAGGPNVVPRSARICLFVYVLFVCLFSLVVPSLQSLAFIPLVPNVTYNYPLSIFSSSLLTAVWEYPRYFSISLILDREDELPGSSSHSS